jgi:pimeloyl-ACP methyl ester carboxylesterase
MGAMMPTALAGAVLNDIGPDLDETGVKRIQGYVGKTTPPRTFEEAADYLARIFGSAFPDYGPEDWRREAHLTYREDGHGGLADNYDPRVSQSIAGGPPQDLDIWALFASLSHVPVLSIRGATSDIFHPDTQNAMKARMPGLQTLTVANRGHAPSLDEPECLKALPDFFAECDAKAARHQ